MSRKAYSDADKAKYWREKALAGSANISNGSRTYSKNEDQTQYKKSGAIFTKIGKGTMEGLHAVNAWKKTSRGMIKATAFPISNKSSESAKGNQYIPYLVTVIDMSSLQATKYNAIMNIQTKVLVIQDLSMCITPNGSGKTKGGTTVKGYFGRNYK